MYVKRMMLILGRPGVGKTRLAGTFPDPYFLDLENGASSAHPGEVRRLEIATDSKTLTRVQGAVAKLGKLEFREEALWGKDDLPIRTLIIDSIDAIQQAAMDFQILQGKRTIMEQRDWGTLLAMVRPLNMQLRSLPIHVVVIAHTKTRESSEKKVGIMDLSVQGALRDQMPRWYDVILHIAERHNNQRIVLTQPNIYMGSRWLAKDRHNLLAKLADDQGAVALPADKAGYPNSQIANAICGFSAAES